jgi:MoaA/NifB/PqqE/SkfB family radical SAM enzyme
MSGNVIVWGYPAVISFETSSVCNLSCQECICGRNELVRNHKFPNPNLFSKIIEQSAKKSSYIQLFFQGEPLLNPQLPAYIKICTKKKLASSVSTNANVYSEKIISGLVDNQLSKIIVSFDGASQESYAEYRKGGNIQNVKRFIRNLAQYKRNKNSNFPIIETQFLVNKKNESDIKKAKAISMNLGSNIFRTKTMQIYSEEGFRKFLPINKKYSRYYKNKENNYISKTKKTKGCRRLWTTFVVSSDGCAGLCCYDKNTSFALGSIETKTIKTIWKSEKFNLYRKALLEHKNIPSICNNCNG